MLIQVNDIPASLVNKARYRTYYPRLILTMYKKCCPQILVFEEVKLKVYKFIAIILIGVIFHYLHFYYFLKFF